MKVIRIRTVFSNYREAVELGTNPTDADTDGDGIADAAEVEQGTDPLKNSRYALWIENSNPTYGIVSGGGIYVSGKPVSLTATPEPGYVFSQWAYSRNCHQPTTPHSHESPSSDLSVEAEFGTRQFRYRMAMVSLTMRRLLSTALIPTAVIPTRTG